MTNPSLSAETLESELLQATSALAASLKLTDQPLARLIGYAKVSGGTLASLPMSGASRAYLLREIGFMFLELADHVKPIEWQPRSEHPAFRAFAMRALRAREPNNGADHG